MQLLLLIGLFVFCCVTDAIANQKFKITWVKSDSHPFNIARGSNLVGQGICDGVMNEIIKAAPEIDFDTYVMPQVRFSKLMDDGAKVCFACMIHRDEPTSRATYSIPNIIYPPYVIATTPDIAKLIKLKYGDPVDLSHLMADELLQFGRDSGRKFDSDIQGIVANSEAYKRSVVIFNERGAVTALMRMMGLGRIDYLIDYPSNIKYLNTEVKMPIEMLAIKQVASKYIKGAIGCSTTAPDNFAHEALARINAILKDRVLQSPTYIKHLDFWMSSSFSDYISMYEEIIVKGNKTGNQTGN